jgi:hypothetical protein
MQTDMTAYDCEAPYPEVPYYSQFCYNASFHNALLLLGDIFCKIRKITGSYKTAFFFHEFIQLVNDYLYTWE